MLLENEELSLGTRLPLQITRVVGVEQKILAIPPDNMGSVTPEFKLGPTQMHRLSASETGAMLRNGYLTVSNYAERLLSRISERNDTVNAWAYLDPHLVMEQARRLDAIPANERGPLHGVAVGIKDNLTTRGRLWTRGQLLLLTTRHRYADAIWLAHLSR